MSKTAVSAAPVALMWDVFRVGFTDVKSHPGIADEFAIVSTAAGQTISQVNGELRFTTGTAVNEQTMARSKRTFTGPHSVRWKCSIGPTRIINTTFTVEMADLIADNVRFTNPTATSVVVTIPAGIFDSRNVGQTVSIANILGVAGVPGDAVIAAASTNPTAGTTALTLTVAGWPGVGGTGTCIIYGWNCYRAIYDGATATNVKFDVRRRGYNATFTAVNSGSSVSPGHIAEWVTDGQSVLYRDVGAAVAPSSATFAQRGARLENIPDDDIPMFLWLHVINGTTAPAADTTWTVGFIAAEQVGNSKTQAIAPCTTTNSITGAVSIAGNPNVVGAGTHAAAVTGNPLLLGAEARTALGAAVTSGQLVRVMATVNGAVTVMPYSIPEQARTFNSALTTTSDVPIAAAGTGLKNHLMRQWFINTGASAVDVIVKDGATERERYTLPVNVPVSVADALPMQVTANTAINYALSAAGTVRVASRYFIAP